MFPLLDRFEAFLAYLHTMYTSVICSSILTLWGTWRVGPIAFPVSFLHVQARIHRHSYFLSLRATAQNMYTGTYRPLQSEEWKGTNETLFRGHWNRGTPFAPAAHASAGLSGLTDPDPSLKESNLWKPPSLSPLHAAHLTFTVSQNAP